MVQNTDAGMMSQLEVAIRKAERQDWVITDIFAKITESNDSLKENQKIILIYWLLYQGLSNSALKKMMDKEVELYLEKTTIRKHLDETIIPILRNLLANIKSELLDTNSISKEELWLLLKEVFCRPISLEEGKHRYWLFLGLAESLRPGSPLYAGTHSIAIDPPYIPTTGTQVIVTSNRNLRQGIPLQTPERDFQLQEITGVLPPLSKVIILDLKNFVDPTSAERRERVWAAIKWIN